MASLDEITARLKGRLMFAYDRYGLSGGHIDHDHIALVTRIEQWTQYNESGYHLYGKELAVETGDDADGGESMTVRLDPDRAIMGFDTLDQLTEYIKQPGVFASESDLDALVNTMQKTVRRITRRVKDMKDEQD